MSQVVATWLEVNADRALARQRGQADAAKLLATFAVGAATTLVATGLQVRPSTAYDRWGMGLLAASLVFAVLVVLLDRLSEPDHDAIVTQSQVSGWNETMLMTELQTNLLAVTRDNEAVVRGIWKALAAQLMLAVASGIVAGVGLLGKA